MNLLSRGRHSGGGRYPGESEGRHTGESRYPALHPGQQRLGEEGKKLDSIRHPRESGDPGCKLAFKGRFKAWIPAFAGMTASLTLKRFRGSFLEGFKPSFKNRFKTWIPAFAGMTTLLLFLSPSIAATNKKAGTSGAQFLKIGAGARPTAMGDSFVAVGDDVNSVYFNPAGIAEISRPEISVMHTQWIADTNYDFGAFCYPTDLGAIAISVATLKVEDIQRRAADETRGGDFEALDASYALSYAHNINPLTSVGVTGRFIKQEIDSTSAGTWAGDIGIIKRLHEKPMSLGLAVKHLGQAVEFKNESDPLPMTVDAGAALTLLKQKLLITADGKWFRDNDPGFGIGLEYKHSMRENNRFTLRAGYNSTATDSDGTGLTLGGGLGFGRFDMDFAWVPFADLGNTYRYALRVRF